MQYGDHSPPMRLRQDGALGPSGCVGASVWMYVMYNNTHTYILCRCKCMCVMDIWMGAHEDVSGEKRGLRSSTL